MAGQNLPLRSNSDKFNTPHNVKRRVVLMEGTRGANAPGTMATGAPIKLFK
ncbi:Hypothetical protein CINCED_3A016135, partial [Cinara cedri]